ncbi:protein of unknown function [Beijerinckiaceae bacterium RH AL1]|nr:hypothetical protein [Beijerinckiaceae bacterium]VVB43019.1 protein of unknown function [Beijerinckiaceae bacterium RH AL8]VVB43032.1 protein of unknown function [Beijerinckiaceae bacterium RH CH11]VVC53626.1 protein of unknown function [Beijerinckiaceae bacterium RH AL1]
MATFTPYIGVGDLKFGMAQRDVAALIGSPKMVRKTPGEDSEMRGPDKPRVSIAAGRLVEISFLPAAGALILDGDDLFAGDGRQRLRRIQADYGPLFTHVGSVSSSNASASILQCCRSI